LAETKRGNGKKEEEEEVGVPLSDDKVLKGKKRENRLTRKGKEKRWHGTSSLATKRWIKLEG